MPNTTTLHRAAPHRTGADPVSYAFNKVMTSLVLGLNALDRRLRERPARVEKEAAELLRLADSYEATQPSYAADLRAAALVASRGETTAR